MRGSGSRPTRREAVALAAAAVTAGRAARVPMILDTDIGDDIDDAYALALIALDRRADLLAVTTVLGDTPGRARIAGRLLAECGRSAVPVFAGRATPHPTGRQFEWAANWRGDALQAEPAAEATARILTRSRRRVTLVAIGPLTNVAELLHSHPAAARRLARIVLMGGAMEVGYGGRPPAVPEYNIRVDPAAAQAVFSAGIPLTVAPLDATATLQLDAAHRRRIYASGSPCAAALQALTERWGDGSPTLFDVMAAAEALGDSWAEPRRQRVEVRDDGMTVAVDGPPTADVLYAPRVAAFLDHVTEALSTRA